MGRTKELLETDSMNKYLFFYWREYNDVSDWYEKEIKSDTMDNALIEFRKSVRFAKLESIKLID